MSHVITRSNHRPWYKERWPWLLMAGPAVVIVAGVVTVWLAVVSNDGLVTDDYYKQGLAVNQRLLRDHQADRMGLYADVMLAGRNVRLLLRSEGDIATVSVLTLKLSHPTRAGLDQSVQMAPEGQGVYSGKLVTEIAGRWLVSIEDPAGQWRLHGEWLAESNAPLRLMAKMGK